MTSKLLFGNCAKLRKEKIDPQNFLESKYIGLEHIAKESLSLLGYGRGSDVDSPKQRFYEGDILFGKLRPYFRKVIIAPFDGICSTDIWVVQPKASIDRDFLFYWMASKGFVDSASVASEGTRMPRAKWDWVEQFEVPVKNYKEQISASRTLRYLDCKIQQNALLSETLESIAQSIFKSWFIDFDPVHAKSRGEKPFGMDDETAALFPDSFAESELGMIPKGSKVGKFGDFNNLLMGQSPPGESYNNEGLGLPFYQGRTDFGARFPERRVYCMIEKRVANPSETLVSVRAPVGDINQAIEKCVIGRGIAAVMHKSNSSVYTYSLISSLKSQLAFFNGEGSVFGAINKTDFENLRILEPSNALIKKFDQLLGPTNLLIHELHQSSKSMVSLRDSLLPKLISGELLIPEELLVS
jgi:type I restriction enzyme S subunit